MGQLVSGPLLARVDSRRGTCLLTAVASAPEKEENLLKFRLALFLLLTVAAAAPSAAIGAIRIAKI
jgi:hypothetical protein